MSPYVAPLLAHDEANVIRAALAAYLSETDHYLRGSGFEPCAPECPHCQPRVEHFADVRRGLELRKDAITRALAVMLTASGSDQSQLEPSTASVMAEKRSEQSAQTEAAHDDR